MIKNFQEIFLSFVHCFVTSHIKVHKLIKTKATDSFLYCQLNALIPLHLHSRIPVFPKEPSMFNKPQTCNLIDLVWQIPGEILCFCICLKYVGEIYTDRYNWKLPQLSKEFFRKVICLLIARFWC